MTRCLLVFALAVLIVASNEAQEAGRLKQLSIGIEGKFEVLDPHGTASGGDWFVVGQIYETLVRPSVSRPVSWEPCLATRWQVSNEGKSWTFTLREGVRFHDGTNLNAQVVKASFRRFLEPDHRAAPVYAPYRESFSHIAAIETPAPAQVVFKLSRPDFAFQSLVSLSAAAVISQGAIDKLTDLEPGERRQWFSKNSAGTGTYKLDSGESLGAGRVDLVAHDTHWAGKPLVAKLRITAYTDPKARLKACQDGSVDIAEEIAGGDWAAARADKHLHLEVRDAARICYLGMNCDSEVGGATADKRVREAIALAIDREPIIEKASEGAAALHTLLPAGLPGHPAGYKPATDRVGRDEALAKARKLVVETGAGEKTLDMIIPNVPRPYLRNPTEIADLLKTQIEAVGLQVRVTPTSMGEIMDAISKGSYNMMLLGWIGDATYRPADFWEPLLGGEESPAPTNIARFFDAKVAKVLKRARNEPDPAKGIALYEDLEKSVHDDFRPIVPLYSAKRAWAWRAKLSGVKIDAVGNLRLGGVNAD